jgi:hypothetical protein
LAFFYYLSVAPMRIESLVGEKQFTILLGRMVLEKARFFDLWTSALSSIPDAS